MTSRYVSDQPFQLNTLDGIPDEMELKILTYRGLGIGIHYYANLITPSGDDEYIEISLTRPILLIEREQDPRLARLERTNGFTTKDAAENRAIEFAKEHGIRIWKKEWYVAGRDARGEYEDYHEKVLYTGAEAG